MLVIECVTLRALPPVSIDNRGDRHSLSAHKCLRHDVEILAERRPNIQAKKEGVVSVNAVVLMQLCQGDSVFLCESKSTLFGFPKVDAMRNHWLRFVYNTTAQLKCSNLCEAFYGLQFLKPSRVQGHITAECTARQKSS